MQGKNSKHYIVTLAPSLSFWTEVLSFADLIAVNDIYDTPEKTDEEKSNI